MLELRGLQKRFGDVIALRDCSFRLEPGRVMGFLGRNGAGKTTAMRAIFGLIRPDAGSVTWQGRAIGREDRLRFGYMPEERGLYPRMGVAEQLEFFGRLRGLAADKAKAQAASWLERMDLADRAADHLDKLSHGNQQKVQLAAALMGDPELLVLDEPFSGLDAIASRTLMDVIRDRARAGVAVVFSSHQLELIADICDEIAILTRGQVVLSGRLEQIKRGSAWRFIRASMEGEASDADLREAVRSLQGDVLWRQGEQLRLRVPASTQAEEAVAALQRLGRIVSFGFDLPSLEDIFREAVGE